ncbi:MAG: 30S ribosome-binding factor RbfA [Acidimicrobiales bacterium]|nr:30S ribosome-binding factor RbfA [Actinomycetota bacterium]
MSSRPSKSARLRVPERRRSPAPYRRSERVNELLREVLADEIERLADADERLRLATVTGVDTSADLRHATVFLASLPGELSEALDEHRIRLQRVIGRQVRMKRTPQLGFSPDPAVASGAKVDEILRRLGSSNEESS